ncbi:MAG: hypothetical protein ACOH1Y_10080 [Propionicimonas sp.]
MMNPTPTSSRSRVTRIVLAAVVGAAVLVIGIGMGRATAPSLVTVMVTTPVPTTLTATATRTMKWTPSMPHGDQSVWESLNSADVEVVARQFADGWMEADPTKRRQLLEASATRQFVDELMKTDPYKIHRYPVSHVETTGVQGAMAVVTVYLTGAPMAALTVMLSYDPTVRGDWLAYSVS